MADSGNDYLIDGKSLYTLRVVDLKEVLTKKDIPFKKNATKAQLQALLIEHLNEQNEEKSSEDTVQSGDDTNESVGTANNVPPVDHLSAIQTTQAEQTEATDLSQSVTSSVSFGDRSIKLTIKLQPNESPNRSPRKSPVKEMRSPVIAADICTNIISNEKIGLKSPKQKQIEDLSTKVVVEETPKPAEEIPSEVLSPKNSISTEEPKQVVIQEVAKEVTQEIEERSKVKDLTTHEESSDKSSSSSDSTDSSSTDKSSELSDSQDLSVEKESVSVVEDKSCEPIKEQTTETLVETPVNTEKDIPIVESIAKQTDEKTDSIVEEKESKTVETAEQRKSPEKVRAPRRRRWGGSATNESQLNTPKGISSDQIKEMISVLDTTTTTTGGVSGTDSVNNSSKVSKSDTSIVITSSLSRTQTTAATTSEMPAKRDIRVVRKSVSVAEEEQTTKETVKPPPIVDSIKKPIVTEIDRKTDEPLEEEKREPTPPRNPPSEVVFIRNLVRPFTLLQLKDVLGKTGKLIEERFWIDRIKSKCYASYDTIDEAVATRLALHGSRWPNSNPKCLSVDFATKDELDFHLNGELSANKNIVVKKAEENVSNEKYDIVIKSEENQIDLREKDGKVESRPVREWDRQKLLTKEEDDNRRGAAKRRPNSPAPRSESREDGKRRRNDSTKVEERVRPADSTSEAVAAEAQPETESPAKLLDDLFKKTNTTPSIYWLPLTEEQVVVRDALRAEEDKKRLEEKTQRDEQFRQRQEDRRPFESVMPFRNDRMQRNSPSMRRNFGRPFQRRSPPGRHSPPPFRGRRSPPNRFSRSRSRSPAFRRKR